MESKTTQTWRVTLLVESFIHRSFQADESKMRWNGTHQQPMMPKQRKLGNGVKRTVKSTTARVEDLHR